MIFIKSIEKDLYFHLHFFYEIWRYPYSVYFITDQLQ